MRGWLLATIWIVGLLAGCGEPSEPLAGGPEAVVVDVTATPAEATVEATVVVGGSEATATATTASPASGTPTAVAEPPTTSSPGPVMAPLRPAGRGENGRLLFIRRGNLHLWSEGGSRQLTSTADLLWPRWSPDGQRIAVVRRGDAFSELVLLDQQGQNPVQLTRHQSRSTPGSKEYITTSIWAVTPGWEPTGNRLIYAADVATSNTTLYLIDARGGQPRAVAGLNDLHANLESPSFAPDSQTLTFCLSFDTPTQLWALNLTSGVRTPLTDGKQTVYDPAWSPDGRALAVAIVDGNSSSLWALSPDGKQRTPLVRRPVARAPTWSPDGSQLAFIGEEGGKFNVYIVDINGDGAGGLMAGQPRRLTVEGDIDATSGLSWAR
jgi:TolB protein